MKNLDIRNKIDYFAESQTKRFLLNANRGSYFYGCLKAIICKDRGLSIHCWLLRLRCNFSWSRCGAIAFLIFTCLNFSSMTKRMKNASNAQGASTSTQTERNAVSIEAFNIEKDAKNQAYYFILSKGLLDSFAEFCKIYHSDDPHQDCINYLAAQL